MKEQQEGPTWYQFCQVVIPAVPNLLKACLTEVQQMTVLSSLFKARYGIEKWDPELAQDLDWLFDLDREVENDDD